MPKVLSPLISVLMPVRAFTDFTIDAVDSVLTQTHHRLELVIVGHDDINALLTKLPKDNRIRGISRNAPGIVAALNTGLQHCTGEYIARMDDDDICDPTRLETQLQFAKQNPKIDFIGARVRFFDKEQAVGAGNARYEHWLNSLCTVEDINNACFIESPMPHPTFFAHKQFWQSMQGYRDNNWPEDYDFVLRAWLHGFSMGKPEPVLLAWREHANRLTKTDSRYSREAFIRAKAWALMQPESRINTDRNIWICGTGRNARYWHDALVEQGATISGFVELDSAPEKTHKRHLPVVRYATLLNSWNNELVITAISNATARQQLIDWFSDNRRVSGCDYVLGS